jgi:hypothetical protein
VRLPIEKRLRVMSLFRRAHIASENSNNKFAHDHTFFLTTTNERNMA